MNEIMLASAALQLVRQLIPAIQARLKAGNVTVEEQQALMNEYLALKELADGLFEGPEWEITPD